MKRSTLSLAGVGFLCLCVTTGTGLAQHEPRRDGGSNPDATAIVAVPHVAVPYQEQNQVIGRYCLRCHNDSLTRGGLSLENFDVANAHENVEVVEKMIRKLEAGMMPALPARRPDEETLTALVTALASRIDAAAATNPNPGGRTFQRLNRVEYERSVRDLLDLEIDAGAYLPPDPLSAGFDNIADVQGLSATVMEGYLGAAAEISRLAVGDPAASVAETKYTMSRYASQRDRVEGAPYGTRGGLSVVHNFPADGEYEVTITLFDSPEGLLFGKALLHQEQIEVSVNGERAALLDVGRFMDPDNQSLSTPRIFIRAGAQRISVVFIQRSEGPVVDLVSPHEWSLSDRSIGSVHGITSLVHLQGAAIIGPYNATGVSATPSRRRIFSCRPISPDEEGPCAEAIITRLATYAYRRPTTERDVAGLMSFFHKGTDNGGFEAGVRSALEALLSSPHFVLRFEAPATGPASGQLNNIGDVALASRLSFFLWGAAPDEALMTLAREQRLSDDAVLEEQVRRMLSDPRAAALGTRFAAQWLRLQDLDKVHPDALMFPDFHEELAAAMRRETELFFNSLVEDDRSVLDLLRADYTFVNGRLARHYGIPGVSGEHFRRVSVSNPERRGLLGHSSILTLTSHAERTSPVLRGKWVMSVLLGSPPPPPPPDVPELDATDAIADGRELTVRERLEQHRANPACASCHRAIDPIGLALENFDVTGAWRTKDAGNPVDTSGSLYDGTALTSPTDLREALLKYSPALITTFTENLMAYGIGRRVEYPDMPEIRAIVRAASHNDYKLSSFIVGVATSQAFRTNDEIQLPEVAAAHDEIR